MSEKAIALRDAIRAAVDGGAAPETARICGLTWHTMHDRHPSLTAGTCEKVVTETPEGVSIQCLHHDVLVTESYRDEEGEEYEVSRRTTAPLFGPSTLTRAEVDGWATRAARVNGLLADLWRAHEAWYAEDRSGRFGSDDVPLSMLLDRLP